MIFNSLPPLPVVPLALLGYVADAAFMRALYDAYLVDPAPEAVLACAVGLLTEREQDILFARIELGTVLIKVAE